MHLKLKSYKQKKRMCGPASLRIVLNYYGLKKSEKELKKLTKATYLKGTESKEIVKVARKLGLKAKYKVNSSINELKSLIKKKIPVIIGWFSPESSSHFSVVEGISKGKIYIADPDFGKIRKFNIKEFEEYWIDINWDKLPFFEKWMIIFNLFFQTIKSKMFKKKYVLPTHKKSNLVKREIIIISK